MKRQLALLLPITLFQMLLFVALGIFILNVPSSFGKCQCPHPNPPLNLTNDPSMKPHNNFQLEWWYYLSSLFVPHTKEPFTFVSYFVKVNENCQNESIVFNKVFISSPHQNWNLETSKLINTPLTLNFTINNTSILRQDNTRTLFNRSQSDFPKFNLEIGDQDSFTLQGKNKNGYVPGSFDPECNGAYSASVLRTLTNGFMGTPNYPRSFVLGIGYGEHVLTSISTPKYAIRNLYKPSLGWTCHYIHWNENSLQLCEGSINIEQTRHGMIKYNNQTSWLTYIDFEMFGNKKWEGFDLEWDIYVNHLFTKFNIVTYPQWKNQTTNYFGNNAWIGQIEGTIIEPNGTFPLLGFTEIVKVE